MTDKEKARAYDKLLVKAKQIYNKENDVLIIHTLEDLLPELKESENEKIKKGLIDYFSNFHLQTFADLDPKKILAWLEKQGTPAKLSEEEQNKFAKGVLRRCAISFIDYLDEHKYEGKMCVSNGECEDIEDAFHNFMWDKLHRYYCKYIEKQDKQKPYGQREECSDCQFNYAGECKGSCKMKRNEQELVPEMGSPEEHNNGDLPGSPGSPTDNPKPRFKAGQTIVNIYHNPDTDSGPEEIKEVTDDKYIFEGGSYIMISEQDYWKLDGEPKFKPGEWIVSDSNNIAYVESVSKTEYNLQYKNGRHEKMSVNYIDKCWHSWTIQDVKDGEVLVEDTCTFIIKKLNKDLSAEVYCCLHDDGDLEINSKLAFDIASTYPATKEQRDLLFSEMKEKGYQWLEETKELKETGQEPGKPKFHEGEWIISDTADKDYRICKITGIKDGNYSIESTCGYKGYNRIDVFDNSYRPWTIEDVKDGEVLAAQECYVIFKEITGLNIRCYCTYHYMGFSPSLHLNTLQNKTAFHPATKEESDTLEKAITNAGLKWNAEKKELTAIKPKFNVDDTIQYNGLGHNEYVIKEVHYPTHYINELGRRMDMPYTDANFTLVPHEDNRPEWWSEEDEEIINKISVAVATHYSCDTAAKVENWLKSLRSHLKQGWSKEDEVKLKSVCALIRNTSLKGNKGIEELTIDWIRSLKDRVQSQSKQEWKQENTGDLTDFENAMMHIGESFFGQHAGLDPNDTGAVKEQANLLLGLVPKQEWSEEDERNLNDVILFIKTGTYSLDKEKLIDWLKSLIPQKCLVPSEEEIEKAAQEWDTKANFSPFYMTPTGVKQDITSHEKSFKAGINWILKFLGPQKQWKPSDEQMHAFEQVYDWYNTNFAPSETLTSLYNDLKKLK